MFYFCVRFHWLAGWRIRHRPVGTMHCRNVRIPSFSWNLCGLSDCSPVNSHSSMKTFSLSSGSRLFLRLIRRICLFCVFLRLLSAEPAKFSLFGTLCTQVSVLTWIVSVATSLVSFCSSYDRRPGCSLSSTKCARVASWSISIHFQRLVPIYASPDCQGFNYLRMSGCSSLSAIP